MKVQVAHHDRCAKVREIRAVICKRSCGRTRAFAIALMASLFATPAAAHPHVWVTARMTVEFEKGAAKRIQHVWTFDELYTTMALEGLDTNNDGKYDREELKPLAQDNMEGLSEYGFFTLAKLGDGKIEFGAAADYWLEYANNLLTLHFTLPLSAPASPRETPISITVADDSYYVAFEFAKENAVKLSGEGHAGCTVSEKYLEVSDVAKSLSDAFGSEFDQMEPPGTNTVEITC